MGGSKPFFLSRLLASPVFYLGSRVPKKRPRGQPLGPNSGARKLVPKMKPLLMKLIGRTYLGATFVYPFKSQIFVFWVLVFWAQDFVCFLDHFGFQ